MKGLGNTDVILNLFGKLIFEIPRIHGSKPVSPPTQSLHSSRYAVPPSLPRQSFGSVDSSQVNERSKMESKR